MSKVHIFFFFLLLPLKTLSHNQLSYYVNYVDPFIGSDNSRWTYFAPVSTPYGLIRMGPVTSGLGGYIGGGQPSGYNYNSTTIQGVTLIKSFQISGLLISPSCNNNKTNYFESYIAHQSEKASPGFYQIKTYDNSGAIVTSLTSTQRTGILNFNYECDTQIVAINYGDSLGENGLIGSTKRDTSGKINFLDSKAIEISTTFRSPYLEKPASIFYYLYFDQKYEILKKTDKYILLKFYSKNLNLRAGVSYVSRDGARNNLQKETYKKSFQQVLEDSQKSWEKLLARIDVKSESNEDKVKFYTALWNALSSKSIAEDFDGKYLSYGGQVKIITGPDDSQKWHIFNSDSLWGSHWTLNQLWSLFYPELAINYANNLLTIYRDSGWLPDGWTINQPTPGMPTNSSSIFLASLITKNFYLGDAEMLVRAIKKNNLQFKNRPKGFNKEGLQHFRESGFIPIEDKVYGSASETLEYSFDDYCANNAIQKITGKQNFKLKQSLNNFKNLYSVKNKAFTPKSIHGEFIDNFNIDSSSYFAEGNGSQYLWYVPHDLNFLLNQLGKEDFLRILSNSIKQSQFNNFKLTGNTSGYANLKYNPGNETDMHMPWIFSAIHRSDLTRFYVKDIIQKFYGSSPYNGYGYGQDEDQGQLSSWFVMSSLGLFDITGNCSLSNSYNLIPPIFKKITINSSSLKLVIDNNTEINRYDFKFYLDSKQRQPYVTYQELREKKHLIFK